MEGVFVEIANILLSSSLSLLILFILTKIMGYRQLTQLSFFDYVIGITIGSIAAEMATNLELQLWKPVLAMTIYALASIIIDALTIKSIKARRFFIGVPIVLIDHGVIIRENLKKVHYDINDLLCSARTQGYFNLADIEYAIMENTGNISILAKSEKRTTMPKDFDLAPPQERLMSNVIMDGKIMEIHLSKIGKDAIWVKNELKKQRLTVDEVFLAIVDNNGVLTAFRKNTDKVGSNVFM